MTMQTITLKPGKDIPIIAGHPWVWSEAIDERATKTLPDEPGAIVSVLASNGKPLGLGTYNPLTSIRVRLLTRDADETIDAGYFLKRFKELDVWKRSRLPEKTTVGCSQ